MKKMRIPCMIVLMLFVFKASFGQSPNVFESPNVLKDFLDKKTYIVPEYGTIRFDFNNSDTKKMRDSRERDGADDEVVDLIFDVTIKKNQSRRKEKTGYKIEMKIDLRDPENADSNPSSEYVNSFLLARNVIYPIKGFPAYYHLFADGELYFSKVNWKNIPFSEYKSIVTMTRKGDFKYGLQSLDKEYATTTYIQCIPTR
jgi:hypothetical protein